MGGADDSGGPAPEPGPLRFGNAAHHFSIHVDDGVAHIACIGDPEGTNLQACMAHALGSGLMTPRTPTLVDLLQFRGTIDWKVLQKVAELTEKPPFVGAPSRVAYVARDGFVPLLLKVIGYIFPSTQHRLFSTHEQALAWLKLRPASSAER